MVRNRAVVCRPKLNRARRETQNKLRDSLGSTVSDRCAQQVTRQVARVGPLGGVEVEDPLATPEKKKGREVFEASRAIVSMESQTNSRTGQCEVFKRRTRTLLYLNVSRYRTL